MGFVDGGVTALVVLFIILFVISAMRDLNSAPCFHRLRSWMQSREHND
ncbi:hypothetical protein [Mesorhizobium sp.]